MTFLFKVRLEKKVRLELIIFSRTQHLLKYISQLFNPVFIHQTAVKWKLGGGLSIYRNLAKYYIKLSGIWDELCLIEPGYCK